MTPPRIRVLTHAEITELTWVLHEARSGDRIIGPPVYNEHGDRIGQLALWQGPVNPQINPQIPLFGDADG